MVGRGAVTFFFFLCLLPSSSFPTIWEILGLAGLLASWVVYRRRRGIARQLEGAAQVRLEIVQLPKPIHGAGAYSLGFRQGPAAPVRHAFGFGFQSRGNQCVCFS